MDVPALHVTGWYDDLSDETQTNFIGMRTQSRTENARRWQRLLIGPWGHGVPRISDCGFVFGDVDFGRDVKIDFQAMQAKLVRLSPQGHRQRRRQGSAGQDLRHGREQVARRTGVAARARASHALLPAQQGLANTRFGDGMLSTDAPATSRRIASATIRAIPCRHTAATDAATTRSRRWVRSISA